MSLIEQLKAAPVRRVEQVKGTPYGDDIYVCEITGREFDDAARNNKNEDGDLGRVEFVAITLCDKEGKPVIDFADPSQRALVGNMGNATLTKLFKAAQKINGIDNPQKGED